MQTTSQLNAACVMLSIGDSNAILRPTSTYCTTMLLGFVASDWARALGLLP